MTGTRITFFVPFSGDPELFKCRPSTFNLNPPQGVVRGNELVFVYDRTTQEVPNIGSEFDRELQSVQQHISRIADQVEQFNSTIRPKVSQQIGARREKLLQDRGIIEGLGFPLKRRSRMPATYASPEVKRRIVPQLPPVSTKPYRPEPTLAMDEYEHILSVISNMVMVMERSPRAFKTMGEEDLRQHFLMQLNGQYEGQATGETFNYGGKTDILVRAEGRTSSSPSVNSGRVRPASARHSTSCWPIQAGETPKRPFWFSIAKRLCPRFSREFRRPSGSMPTTRPTSIMIRSPVSGTFSAIGMIPTENSL